MKRNRKEVRKAVLNVLKDNKFYSLGYLERKVNINWKTIRDHCEDLELFDCIILSEDKKIRITKKGIELLNKLKFFQSKLYKP